MSEYTVFICGYCCKGKDDAFPCRQCLGDGVPAPCESDDDIWGDEPDDIDDDCGFDPYEGCYTYDC